MTVDKAADPSAAPPFGPAAAAARNIVQAAAKAALGTLDAANGGPYVSLVLVAADARLLPVLLLSGLALHTRNLAADARASLLFDASGRDGDPMAGARVTLIGRLLRTSEPGDRALFLGRHPAAARYADFPDFHVYRLQLASAHFIGGFGRIVDLAPADLDAAPKST